MTLSFGDYEIDIERRELRRAKTPVHAAVTNAGNDGKIFIFKRPI
jgi:hypothetical protein